MKNLIAKCSKFALLTCLMAVTSCSGGGGGNSSSNSTNSNSVTPKKSAWIYLFEDTRTISRFTADGETGRVYTEGHTPDFLTSTPADIAITRNGETVYMLDRFLGNISLLQVNEKSGALRRDGATAIPPSVLQIVASPTERFLYGFGLSEIHTFAIDPTTQALTLTSSVNTTVSAGEVILDPNERFLYLRSTGKTMLSVYTIDASTGALTAVDADPTTAGHQDVAFQSSSTMAGIEPGGRYLYTTRLDRVVKWNIDQTTGVPTRMSEEFTGILSSSNGLAIQRDSSMLYVGFLSQDLVTFSIDATTGDLTRVDANSVTAGVQNTTLDFTPRDLIIHPSGRHLLVFQFSTGEFANFELEAATGLPKNPTTVIAREGATPVRVLSANRDTPALRDPSFLYVNGAGPGASVESFEIDPENGDLTPIEFIPAAVTGNLISDRANRFLYSVNSDVEGFEIDADSGLLTSMGILTGPNSFSPIRAVVNPSGWAMYSFSFVPTSIPAFMSYNCDADAELAPLGNWAPSMVGGPDLTPFATGDVAVDPIGKFAYLCNAVSIRVYPISSNNRVQPRLDADPIAAGVQDFDSGVNVTRIAVDPLGRFLYSLLSSFSSTVDDGRLSCFRIEDTGAIQLIDADPTVAGVNRLPFVGRPLEIHPDPTGRFVYVTDNLTISGLGVSTIAAFALDEATGQLNAIDADPATTTIDYYRNDGGANGSNADIEIEPSGRFMYISASLGGAKVVQRYEINQQTGELENLTTATTSMVAGNLLTTGSF